MRCFICDFSPNLSSIYNEGLVTGCNGDLEWDEISQAYFCQSCRAVIHSKDSELEEEEYENVDEDFDE